MKYRFIRSISALPHAPSPRRPVKTPQGWVTTITTKLLTDSSHARADRWKREREGGGEEGENGENPARRTRRTALKILLHTLSSSSSLAAMVMGNESGKWEWRMGRGRGRGMALDIGNASLSRGLPVGSCPFTCPHGQQKRPKRF